MLRSIRNFLESVRKPLPKEVYFRSLPTNRKLMIWYADKVVKADSTIDPIERLREVDEIRKQGGRLTFISNHLTYADSHIIETLFRRAGFADLANHLIHIAGQKTYLIYRRLLTRSLNTIRVYQPKAGVDDTFRRRMNARALRWASHLKKRGYSLLVFPEGTRTRLAKRFNLHCANPRTTLYFRNSMVVPLALMGSENIMPLGSTFQRRGTVHLRVGPPFQHAEQEQSIRELNPNGSDREVRQLLMRHYMEQIHQLLDTDYRYIGK